MTLPALATLSDVEAALGRPASDAALVAQLLAEASAALRAQLGMPVSLVSGEVAELDSDGAEVLVLPRWPVAAVSSVIASGQTVDPTTFEWSRSGVLRRLGGWPCGYRSVVVTYDHGYATVPASVVASVAQAVARRYDALTSGGVAPGVGGAFCSVGDVLALVPEARIDESLIDAIPSRPTTTADVVAWIVQAEGLVMARCAGWDLLYGSEATSFRAAARRIAAHYAAAALEGARYPERSGVSDTTYAEWLRKQATDELDALAGMLAARGEHQAWTFSQVGIAGRGRELNWAFA